jgi:predicted nucleotidyltransferase
MHSDVEKMDPIARRDELLTRTATTFAGERAAAIHLFGSLARGDGDDLSDIDLWITVPDDKIEHLIERRFEVFNGIAEVVISHEAPRNRPPGGSYSLVIHRVGEVLIQTDYYLAPDSTSVILPEARHLYGDDSLPRGPWILDSTAEVVRDIYERVDFLICMSFIGIKKSLRGDIVFLTFLSREYRRFWSTYRIEPIDVETLDDVLQLRSSLATLLGVSTARQSVAIAAVDADCLRLVRRYQN